MTQIIEWMIKVKSNLVRSCDLCNDEFPSDLMRYRGILCKFNVKVCLLLGIKFSIKRVHLLNFGLETA